MSSKCIRDTVNKVKMKYQESDPFRLAAAMKIIVKRIPLGTASNCCKGFCMRESRKTCIPSIAILRRKALRFVCPTAPCS